MSKTKHYIKYYDIDPYPSIYLGVTTDPKAFQKELHTLKIYEHVEFTAGKDACTHFLSVNNELTMIITIKLENCKTLAGTFGLLVHEIAHVWQRLQDEIGERTRPSHEMEAYHLQQIATNVFHEVLKNYKGSMK